jgi:hypothetical protein
MGAIRTGACGVSVWLTIPSARPPEEAEKVLKLWRERGYGIALVVDTPEDAKAKESMADIVISSPVGYRGYSKSVNALIALVMTDPANDWFIIGGDDVEPDPNHSAEEIARQTTTHFGVERLDFRPTYIQVEQDPAKEMTMEVEAIPYSTFGVMQPTGDRFANGSIDKIAGSAWIGREFARRMYGGKGPLWPEYTRFYMDEELQQVAQKYGVFQQRRDLIHLHHWYGRATEALDSETIPVKELPAHLREQEKLFQPEKQLFLRRQRAGFPGSEPIA